MENQRKLSSEEKRINRNLRKLKEAEEKQKALELAAINQRIADEKYMKEAVKLAKKAADINEVPIGCVIVYENKIIARAYNRRNTDKSSLAHAEIRAIKKASKYLNDWRLENCTIYITLEPCQMCAGAIVQARIKRAVMACMNPKAGCAGSVINILNIQQFNHQVEITKGILEEECSKLLSDFFTKLRYEKLIKK